MGGGAGVAFEIFTEPARHVSAPGSSGARPLADGAVADDGLLDLVLVEEGRREELGHSIERSRLAGGGCPVGGTAFAAERCRRLELLWQGDALHLDSVLWAADGRPPFRKVEPLSLELPVRIEVEAVPAALQVLVPPA